MTIKLSNVYDYALKIFLCMAALFYLPIQANVGDPVMWGYMVQELFFRYGVVLLFALSCMVPRVRQLTFSSFPMLLVCSLITAVLFGFDVSFRTGILNIFMGLVFYKMIYESIQINKLKQFAWWFGWLLLINFIWCGLQWHGIDMLFSYVAGPTPGKMDSIIGFMRLKVHLGILAALLTPMVICYAPAFLLCIIPLVVFSQSSTAALAVVVSCIVLGWYRARNITLFILCAALLAFGVWFIFFFDMPGGQFGERFKVWGKLLELTFKQNTIIGNGIGRFKTLNILTMQKNGTPLVWMWAHNEFLQSLYELGVVGIACITSYIIGIHKNVQKFLKDKAIVTLYSSFLAILILSAVQFPWHLARFVPIMLFIMASLHASVEEQKNG